METLIIRALGVVNNPEDFKKAGQSNIAYMANLLSIDPSKPPIFGATFKGQILKVRIEGATIYKAGNGSTIDFANPFTNEVTFDSSQTGTQAYFAFIPTKAKGYIRLNNNAAGFTRYGIPSAANDAVMIEIELSELKNTNTVFFVQPQRSGYTYRAALSGDINGFSIDTLTIFEIPSTFNITNKFKNKYWSKPLPSTLTNFSLRVTKLEADIDLVIFENTSLLELAVAGNQAVRVFGSIDKILAVQKNVIIQSNYSQDGITGTLNSLGTNFTVLNIHAPNLVGGYTTRNFTLANGFSLKINAPKVAATDWDLLLADLANTTPNITSGVVQVNKRTAASDASVASLSAKGVTVIVGF